MSTLIGMDVQTLLRLARNSIEALEDERGILASARDEVYGCIFGRDSLISGLKLLRVYERTHDPYYLALVRKILTSLSTLQGTEHVPHSGEEPGKIIHEYRPHGHEHLTKRADEPWYLYPDDIMRNFDSVDATPLYLMLMARFFRVSRDGEFITAHMPHIVLALEWVMTYGDSNGDGFIDYRFHEARTFGGLRTQSWMDSSESLFFEESTNTPHYPVAPVEVQAYAWVALCMWAELLAEREASLAQRCADYAQSLKRLFTERFVLAHGAEVTLAFALDGRGTPLASARSSMGHVLWAAHETSEGMQSILDHEYIPGLVQRLLSPDLFVPGAGVRTLSSTSRCYDPVSYHNGSIWPHDTAMLAQGLEVFGYAQEAARVRESLLEAYRHFKTPIELFGYRDGTFCEYTTSQGGKACRVQAWSAASLLTVLHAHQELVYH